MRNMGEDEMVKCFGGATALVMIPVVAAIAPLSACAHEVDGIAAKVGSETILRSDVLEELRRMGERDESRYEQARNDMIDRKLILKAAAESKMTMQEWVVENRVREIIGKTFGGDRSKLMETLARQKISYPEWFARMKEDMVISAMRWNVVDKNVVASPSAMRKEYEENPDKYAADHKVSVSVLMLSPDEAGKRDEMSERIKTEDIVALGGRKYENVKPEEQFKPEICREIEARPNGTISHWIEIDGWSFLIRKDADTSSKTLSFDEAYDMVEAAVKEAEAERLYKAWIERLRAETYIKVF